MTITITLPQIHPVTTIKSVRYERMIRKSQKKIGPYKP